VKSEKKGKILKVEEKVTIEECEGETYNYNESPLFFPEAKKRF